ncbi:MAG: PIG-L deacetylase family protein [Chloroflexota bacterium]
MEKEPAQILVVTPHPDDAEFGAAGSLIRWHKEGKSIVYVVPTSGDKGTSDPCVKPEEMARIREKEQLAAAKVIGVREVVFLRHPDQSLEDTPEFRKEIVRCIRLYKPETVLAPDPYRRYLWHRDHRITGRVTLDAIFPYARDYHAYPGLVKEGIMPHKVKQVLLWGTEDVNYRMDITAVFERKLAALACHKSQLGKTLSPEMIERLRQRAREMADGSKFELAEAFHCIEILR